MRKDKEIAFKLRKEGKSYRDIQKELGIARSTLCEWFRDVPWSRHLRMTNTDRTWSSENMQSMRSVRLQRLKDTYTAIEHQASVEYSRYRREPLFWAGLMVYAGEGDKRSKSLIRVTNSEFYLHRIFLEFAQVYLGRGRESVKFGLLLLPEHNESLCKEMWSNLVKIGRENFYKTQVMQGKTTMRRLQYGVGMSIISSTALKRKLLRWISLAQDERFEENIDAVIV